MFSEALGDAASAEADELASAVEPAVAAVPVAPVDALASEALFEGAALSLDALIALPVVELEALLSIGAPWLAAASLGTGLAVSLMPVCGVVVVDGSGWLAVGALAVDCALTAPGTMMAAAARRSILRMTITPAFCSVVVGATFRRGAWFRYCGGTMPCRDECIAPRGRC